MEPDKNKNYYTIEDDDFPFLYENGYDEYNENMGITNQIEEVTGITGEAFQEAKFMMEQMQEIWEPTVNNNIQPDVNFDEILEDICDMNPSRITETNGRSNNYVINECSKASVNVDNVGSKSNKEYVGENDMNESSKYLFSSQFPATMNNLYTPLDLEILAGEDEEEIIDVEATTPPFAPALPTTLTTQTLSMPLTTTTTPESVYSQDNSETLSSFYHVEHFRNEENEESSSIVCYKTNVNNEDNADNNNGNLSEQNEKMDTILVPEPTSVKLICPQNVTELTETKPKFVVRTRTGRHINTTLQGNFIKTTVDGIIIVRSPLKTIETVEQIEFELPKENDDDVSLEEIEIPVIKPKMRDSENRRKQKIVAKADLDSVSLDKINVENIETTDFKIIKQEQNILESAELYKIMRPTYHTEIKSSECFRNDRDSDSSESKNEEKLVKINKMRTNFKKSQETSSTNFSDTDEESDLSELHTFTKQSQRCRKCNKYFKTVRSLLKHSKQCYLGNYLKNLDSYKTNAEKAIKNNGHSKSQSGGNQRKFRAIIHRSIASVKDFNNIKSNERNQRNLWHSSFRKQMNKNSEVKTNKFHYENQKEHTLENIGLQKISNQIAGQFHSKDEVFDTNNKKRPNTRSQSKVAKRYNTDVDEKSSGKKRAKI